MFVSKISSLPAVRRRAGQSLREEKERLTDDRLVPFYFATATLWLLWACEAYHAYARQPPQPKFLLSLAIIATGVSVIVFRRLFFRFRNLNRGEIGELAVAEALDDLRVIGYRTFHDLVRDGFNIDHVVVGPAGVFAIETKFRSGSGEIEFRNGEGLFVNGRPEEKDSLKQARGNARDVKHFIKDHCGLDCWVRPLVVFVGDWRIRNKWRETDARVLTPDQLARHFDQLQPEFTRNEIKLIASHLERSANS